MSVFDDITLTWKGESYTIPSDRVMAAIARIEDRLTLVELQRAGYNVPLAKIAQAYGAALRFAGAKAEDDEVYAAMFADASGSAVDVARQAIDTLLTMMLPPSVSQEGVDTNQPGPTKAPKKKGASTSKQRTK